MEHLDIIAENGALALPVTKERAEALCAYIHKRTAELKVELADITVTEDLYADREAWSVMKETVKEHKKHVEELRDKGKALVAAALEATEAQRVVTQIDSRLWSYSTKADPLCAYAQLSEAVKAKLAQIESIEAAQSAPEPVHTYVIQAEITDKVLKDLVKVFDKAGVTRYRYCVPQSDAAFRKIDSVFE